MLTMDIQLWMDCGVVSVLCAISMSFTLFVPKIRQMEETAKQNHVKYLLHTSLYNAAMSREPISIISIISLENGHAHYE